MFGRSWSLSFAVLFANVAVGVASAEDVTWQRLLAAGMATESANWLMTNGDLGGQRYSTLDDINQNNASGLKLAFSYAAQLGYGDLFEYDRLSAPLVDEGKLYFTDGLGRVMKFDLSQGEAQLLWTAEAAYGQMDAWLAGQWNLTLNKNHVLLTAGDGTVYWIDAQTGALDGTANIGDPETGYQLSAAPLVVGDQLVVGGAGTESGALLQIDALELPARAQGWNIVLGAAKRIAGGSFLRPGVFDLETNLSFWTTSGALPLISRSDEAESNNANMMFAIDPDAGNVRWARRIGDGPPDEVSQAASPILVDTEIEGEKTSKLVHFGDDGYFRRFDVENGELELSIKVFHRDNLRSDTQTCIEVLAELGMPITYSRTAGLVYGAANGTYECGAPDEGRYVGETIASGKLVSVDPSTGKIAAERRFNFPLQSGLLSTAGGVVIAVTADGVVHALHDQTLETIWEYDLPSVRAAPPITFMAGGKQYLAVLSGGGPFYSRLPFRPRDMVGARHVTALVVFALEGRR